jgi:hypothetical protein
MRNLVSRFSTKKTGNTTDSIFIFLMLGISNLRFHFFVVVGRKEKERKKNTLLHVKKYI